jgi:hypothetical protein
VLFRSAGVAAGLLNLAMFLGCMSLAIGGKTYECPLTGCRVEGDVFVQHGQVHLKPRGEQDVYYAAPFAGPPNLELGEDCDDCEVVEQKADHFRVRNRGFFRTTAGWTARGVKLTPCGPPAPETPPPTPALPAEPAPAP